MKSNKLIRNLEKLSRKELTRFKEFVFSPYLNKHEEVRRLVAYISEIYPRLDEKKCTKELIFKSVFVRGKYNEKLLAPVLTYTQRLLEQFWAYEGFREDHYFQRYIYLRQLRSQQAFAQYERLFQELEENPKHSPILGADQSLFRYMLAGEGERYWSQYNKSNFEGCFQKRQNELDVFYLSQKLKDACDVFFRKEMKRDERAPRLSETIFHEVEGNIQSYQHIPSIVTYYKVQRMLRENKSIYFQEALEEFRKWENTFSREDVIELFNQFKNFCLIRVNQGDSKFLEELFKLYQIQLKQGLLIEGGFLSEWNYKNIVSAGLRLQQYSWVRQFIEDQKIYLAPEFQDNAYKFNLASYYLTLGQHHEAMLLLREVEYSDLRYNLGAKTMLLQAYYELKEYEPLFSLTESFRQLLIRDGKMSEFLKRGYYNLFRFTRKAAILSSRKEYLQKEKTLKELKNIQQKISTTNDIFNRAWLEKKLEELSYEIR